MAGMKGISIKLPERTIERLRQQAQATGRTVADLIRERIEGPSHVDGSSVYDATADLAGVLAGRRRSATNDRRRFRHR